MFVLRKRQILLLVCSGRFPAGITCWHFDCSLLHLLDARCPDAEDQREPVGTLVPTGEGPFSASGLLRSFVYEERHSIISHRLPCRGRLSASFGRTSASISIMNLIKTNLLARPDPRLTLCVCVSKPPCRNSHCCYHLGSPPLPSKADTWQRIRSPAAMKRGRSTFLLRTKVGVHC